MTSYKNELYGQPGHLHPDFLYSPPASEEQGALLIERIHVNRAESAWSSNGGLEDHIPPGLLALYSASRLIDEDAAGLYGDLEAEAEIQRRLKPAPHEQVEDDAGLLTPGSGKLHPQAGVPGYLFKVMVPSQKDPKTKVESLFCEAMQTVSVSFVYPLMQRAEKSKEATFLCDGLRCRMAHLACFLTALVQFRLVESAATTLAKLLSILTDKKDGLLIVAEWMMFGENAEVRTKGRRAFGLACRSLVSLVKTLLRYVIEPGPEDIRKLHEKYEGLAEAIFPPCPPLELFSSQSSEDSDDDLPDLVDPDGEEVGLEPEAASSSSEKIEIILLSAGSEYKRTVTAAATWTVATLTRTLAEPIGIPLNAKLAGKRKQSGSVIITTLDPQLKLEQVSDTIIISASDSCMLGAEGICKWAAGTEPFMDRLALYRLSPVLATRLLAELRSLYQDDDFQRQYKLSQQSKAKRSHGAKLVFDANMAVIPKYGFASSPNGMRIMMDEVSRIADRMWDRPVGLVKEDIHTLLWLDERGSPLPVPDEPERSKESLAQQRQWADKLRLYNEREQSIHAAMPPRERRAWSWSRTLSYAQVKLGSDGCDMRRGTAEQPFVFWVILGSNSVEAQLAAEGFFDDANLIGRGPSKLIIWGQDLPVKGSVLRPVQGRPTVVWTSNYEALESTDERPDLVAVLMPEFKDAMPEALFVQLASMISGAPIIVSLRQPLPRMGAMALRQRLQSRLLAADWRNPYSAAAGHPGLLYDDNGWIFAVRGVAALGAVLWFAVNAQTSSSIPFIPFTQEKQPQEQVKRSCLFWGILDLKYDKSQPVLERVKVLETGDGRTSKFSGDGADILRQQRERYKVEAAASLKRFSFVSTDKKLTHDLMDQAGYKHVVPGQVCFPRKYTENLAERIINSLHMERSEFIVLKLCNRSRAAGVMVVQASELDAMLKDLLIPPEDLEAWFEERLAAIAEGSAADLGLRGSTTEEHRRHWWANEHPNFVAERCCASMPTVREGKPYDGTMRVGFALRRKNAQVNSKSILSAEDLEVDWLGGYWKLPKSDMDSEDLRGRLISAARTSGTARVQPEHLAEVYAALGNSVEHLFSGPEPSAESLEEQYADTEYPELASYFVAKCGAGFVKDQERAHTLLDHAQKIAEHVQDDQVQACLRSFIHRLKGTCVARSTGDFNAAKLFFNFSVEANPCNANALYLLGLAHLECNEPDVALRLLNRSLLLDPDFKAPYVALGIAYLRMHDFISAEIISEAGLARHPESPQCHYHIFHACCQQMLESDSDEYGALMERASNAMDRARFSEEGRKRRPDKAAHQGAADPPWLQSDDQLVQMIKYCREGSSMWEALRRKGKMTSMLKTVGWRYIGWRA